MRKLFPELGKIGKPLAVYSTPTSRTPDNRDKPPGVPRPLQPFPEDHWLAVKQGEAVAGFFEHPDGSDAVYFANHNAFAWQGMVVELRESKPEKIKAWQFDKEAGEWVEFRPARLLSFPLAPGDGELFKFVDDVADAGRDAPPTCNSTQRSWAVGGPSRPAKTTPRTTETHWHIYEETRNEAVSGRDGLWHALPSLSRRQPAACFTVSGFRACSFLRSGTGFPACGTRGETPRLHAMR